MADWLGCADVVAGKAGPGMIAEASCCGGALVLTSHLPGQEHGNIEFVVRSGAGLSARTVRSLIGEVERLRDDRAAVASMRLASLRLARPDAADRIAAELAALVGMAPSAWLRRPPWPGSRLAVSTGRSWPGTHDPNAAEGSGMNADRYSGTMLRRAAIAIAAVGMAVPAASEVRFGGAARPLTDDWQQLPISARGCTRLGISFRPRQAEGLGLDADDSLSELLAYPFELIRLGAYWNHIEPAPGQFCPEELDRHIDAAERAGKQIIVCVGPVKTFGYPEFFVPGHHLRRPLPEGVLIEPAAHQELLDAATAFLTRIIERYRDRRAIVAWQVEHEAVDPLGMEHSWRLSTAFARAEVDAARAADPSRPILMNGFLPTSIPVGLQQGWRTRDQGDSLAVAQGLADIVGIDFYPRHALAALGSRAVYLTGSRAPWQQRRRRALFRWAATPGRQVMVSEGQAEPWETVTTPPNPVNEGMASCLPEQLVAQRDPIVRVENKFRSQETLLELRRAAA